MRRSHPVEVAATAGLVGTLLLVAVSFVLPPVLGWDVHARADDLPGLAPLHAIWDPKVRPGSLPAVLLALAALRWGPAWAARLSWRALLLAAYAAGSAWLLALNLVDGPSGLSRALGNSHEYLPTARAVGDVGALLRGFVDRIPYAAAPANWPTHVAGHPPGMLLFFVLLVRVGLGGSLAAGVVVTVIAASIAPAVLLTLRALDAEGAARAAAPFLVFTPAAVFLAVSADAVMTAVAVWGLCCLAFAATRPLASGWPGAVGAGLLLGLAVELSFGLVLVGFVALAVLAAARSWWPLPIAAGAAALVVLAFAAEGFVWWEALPVVRQRYWAGIASERPASYWIWGDLAALAISAGPLVGAGLGAAWAARRSAASAVLLLVAGGAAAVLVADASLMSKAEVERIWLPFVPWLTLGVALLPPRWRAVGLALQVGTALAVEHLLYTSW